MGRAGDPNGARANRLLAALEPDARGRLEAHLQRVELGRGAVLLDPAAELAHAWFPEGCVVSLAVVLRDSTLEATAVGLEGAVGLVEALCGRQAVVARAIVQVAGPALRLPPEPLGSTLEASPGARRLCASYAQALLAEALQAAACNARHRAEARLARWLLLLQDRTGGEAVLPLPREFLARMLGVQRTTVSEVAQTLQGAGLIACRRGAVEILDRAGLEGASCECHAAIRRHHERLLPRPAQPMAPQSSLASRQTRAGRWPY